MTKNQKEDTGKENIKEENKKTEIVTEGEGYVLWHIQRDENGNYRRKKKRTYSGLS